MLAVLKNWFRGGLTPAHDEMLGAIIRVGRGDAVVITADTAHWLPRLRELEAAGLVRIIETSRGAIEVAPVMREDNDNRPAWTAHSNEAAPIVSVQTPAKSKRAGFVCERNPVWLGFVVEFRRTHGRAPTAKELMARFPEMSRATAYNYVRLGGPSLRLVKSGSPSA